MTSLTAHRRAPKSGTTKNLVIFVHGYGADGNDLLGLADPLSQHMLDTVFYAPDAPNNCQMNPAGYEWFPIPWIDGSTEDQAKAGMGIAVTKFNTWLDEVMEKEGVDAAHTALVSGFPKAR